MDPIKDGVEQVIAQVLDGTELKLRLDVLSAEENFKTGEVTLRCNVHDLHTGKQVTLSSRGVGPVDAFVHGMLAHLGEEHVSLRDIRFTDFILRGKQELNREGTRGSDTPAEATIRVNNGGGHEVTFVETSPSVTRAAITAVLRGFEFFVNSERAFVSLHRALLHAKQDKRPDSEQQYTRQLAILVQLSNYTAVLERLPTL